MAINRFGRFLALAVTMGLAACEEGVAVDVVNSGGTVQVAVTPRSSSAKPCVERLVVYRDGNEATAIWQVTRIRDDVCVRNFTIGVVPAGFEAGVRFAPPVHGVTYRVDASGTGFRGRADFAVGERDGTIGHG
ncbi:hypothetical protein [Polymorphobacter megasporae]|uniref:hypothetical protein n=1 Tax=Glacieibacterium megasporae TaxID=2835787 RepID=UPI001C1E2C41|nr:hypothetical protein [Polymorphobacter megasporae]UAJ09150.1 hypothetical protein KTC28_12435 [Polymorphobacter megasporae]